MNETGKTVESALEELARRVAKEEIRALKADLNGNENQQPKLLYTTKEAAKIIGVPRTWLARAARQGDISCVHMGHYVNFTLDNLKAFIEKIKAEKG